MLIPGNGICKILLRLFLIGSGASANIFAGKYFLATMKKKEQKEKEPCNSPEDELERVTRKLKKKEVQIKVLKQIIKNKKLSDNTKL